MVVQKFTNKVYDIPEELQPPGDLVTILDQLEADHPMVKNLLIDQAGVESKILVDNLNDAKEIMFHVRPPNVRQAFLPDGSRIFMR